MIEKKAAVTMDGEWLLARLQQIEYVLDEIRSVAGEGVFVTPVPRGIDLSAIRWLTKNHEPADPDDSWAWAFAYDQEGGILPETEALVKTIRREGKVQVDGYEVTLKGRDNDLLNRKKLKTQ